MNRLLQNNIVIIFNIKLLQLTTSNFFKNQDWATSFLQTFIKTKFHEKLQELYFYVLQTIIKCKRSISCRK
uniref:Uncharacterized protein n=1 Tax=Octopus bimaculoides TaxID=37653 RepID=A0A0L8GT59_OCTBM